MNPTITQETLTKAIDAFNRHDADAFAAKYAEEAVTYDPQYPEPLRGREVIRKDVAEWFRALPDVKGTVENLLVEGDTFACELQMSGTHRGPIAGPTGTIAPTNRRVDLRLGWFGRLSAQNLIVADRRYYDLAGLMQQLGQS